MRTTDEQAETRIFRAGNEGDAEEWHFEGIKIEAGTFAFDIFEALKQMMSLKLI